MSTRTSSKATDSSLATSEDTFKTSEWSDRSVFFWMFSIGEWEAFAVQIDECAGVIGETGIDNLWRASAAKNFKFQNALFERIRFEDDLWG